MKRTAQWLLLALVVASLAQAAWQHARLPERVATHFDLEGKANGWMARDTHTAFHAGTVLFIATLMFGLARFLPKLPNQYVNLPHREHWLAPERRVATIKWMAGLLLGLGCICQIVFLFIFQQVYEANLMPVPSLPLKAVPFSIGMFVFIAGLVALILYRFRRPSPIGQPRH